jgi:hypothetical protein
MGTTHSSDETRGRAKDLAERIGAYHVDLNMDTAVSAVQGIFSLVTGKTPRFGSQGGTNAENLALQNIQVSYSFWSPDKPCTGMTDTSAVRPQAGSRHEESDKLQTSWRAHAYRRV